MTFQHRGSRPEEGIFGNQGPISWEIGPQLGKDLTELSTVKGRGLITWKPWTGGN